MSNGVGAMNDEAREDWDWILDRAWSSEVEVWTMNDRLGSRLDNVSAVAVDRALT